VPRKEQKQLFREFLTFPVAAWAVFLVSEAVTSLTPTVFLVLTCTTVPDLGPSSAIELSARYQT